MDLDDESLATQPLSKLLRDADLIARPARAHHKRRKLQAGTIGIQRTKDVMTDGPVSCFCTMMPPNVC